MSVRIDRNQLSHIMQGSVDYSVHVDACNQALERAGCSTRLRAAMFLAQVGHESAGLVYFRELDPGFYLRGRADLGHGPYEGEQWRGAGPLQLTGKANFRAFGLWCKQQGLVEDAELFVRHPEMVATPRWGWLSASYYWTVARPDINKLADAGDVVGVTRRVNGGLNGLDDRRRRYALALEVLGDEEPKLEFVIDYPRDQVTQETFYNCGPASCQTVIRGASKKLVSEGELARRLGTHTGGTDYIGQFPRVLNALIPGAEYRHRDVGAYPDAAGKQRFWDDVVGSVRAGHGVVVNIVAPPSNYPRAVAPSSVSPAYGGGTVYHYVAVMGVAEDSRGRRVWVADSGFRPFGYWLSFDQLCSLVVPKGYAFSVARSGVGVDRGVFMALSDVEQRELLDAVRVIQGQLIGPRQDEWPEGHRNPAGGRGWPVLGKNAQGLWLTVVDALGVLKSDVEVLFRYVASQDGKTVEELRALFGKKDGV